MGTARLYIELDIVHGGGHVLETHTPHKKCRSCGRTKVHWGPTEARVRTVGNSGELTSHM